MNQNKSGKAAWIDLESFVTEFKNGTSHFATPRSRISSGHGRPGNGFLLDRPMNDGRKQAERHA
ncbi:hypothetical protein [Ensifer canadensis]|uniref:hypothetical protein n=1 Tax=Ensifer canadensis TaxID=555315 RepID=UPI00193F5E5C|nr:hypothetical protein [Ensifer canadensis]UBI77633.1 hypothetical protein J3R84_04045 [Ensifer canadensis]